MKKADRLVFHARKKEKRQSITVALQPPALRELDDIARRCHRSRSNLVALFVDLALTAICIAEARDV